MPAKQKQAAHSHSWCVDQNATEQPLRPFYTPPYMPNTKSLYAISAHWKTEQLDPGTVTWCWGGVVFCAPVRHRWGRTCWTPGNARCTCDRLHKKDAWRVKLKFNKDGEAARKAAPFAKAVRDQYAQRKQLTCTCTRITASWTAHSVTKPIFTYCFIICAKIDDTVNNSSSTVLKILYRDMSFLPTDRLYIFERMEVFEGQVQG